MGKQQEKKMLRNYIPEVNKDKEQLKLLYSEISGVKKKHRMLHQRRFKDVQGKIRALKRNIQVKELKEKGELNSLRKHKVIRRNLEKKATERKRAASDKYKPRK